MFKAISVIITVVVAASTALPFATQRVPNSVTAEYRSLTPQQRSDAFNALFLFAMDGPDCDPHWTDQLNEMIEAMEGLSEQVEPKVDETVEKASKGAVKKTNSPAFKQFFKRFWERIVSRGGMRGIARQVFTRIGPMGTLGAILTFYDVTDWLYEQSLIADLREKGMSLEDAQMQANAISDALIHEISANAPICMNIAGLFLHLQELVMEGRPCLARYPRDPKPRIPHPLSPRPPGGGFNPDNGPGVRIDIIDCNWRIEGDIGSGPC